MSTGSPSRLIAVLLAATALACTAANDIPVSAPGAKASGSDAGRSGSSPGGPTTEGAVDAAGSGGQAGGGGGTETPPGGDPGTGGPAVAQLGATCADDGGCASGHCIGNVCCASTCDKSGETTCGLSGKCGPDGQCAKYGKETICTPESCSTGVYTPPAVCDGQGTCAPPSGTQPCDGAPCEGTRCQMGCSATKPCTAGNYCKDGTCQPKKSGGACVGTDECMSGFCVDGMCCDKACTDTCLTCATGTCAPIAADVMSPQDCPVATAASCGNNGACDGAGGCKKYGSETQCSNSGCSGGDLLDDGRCDGKGTCVKPSHSCKFGCSAGRCNPCSANQGQSCGGGCKPGRRNCEGNCETDVTVGAPCGGPCNNHCDKNGTCVSQCQNLQVCGSKRCGLGKGDDCDPSAGGQDCANGKCVGQKSCACNGDGIQCKPADEGKLCAGTTVTCICVTNDFICN